MTIQFALDVVTLHSSWSPWAKQNTCYLFSYIYDSDTVHEDNSQNFKIQSLMKRQRVTP